MTNEFNIPHVKHTVLAKDGKRQEFTAHFRRRTKSGKPEWIVRFYVDNYKKHKQWAGKGCTGFETQEDAYKWGLFVASHMEIAGDYESAKAICDANKAYRKVKETTLDKVFG